MEENPYKPPGDADSTLPPQPKSESQHSPSTRRGGLAAITIGILTLGAFAGWPIYQAKQGTLEVAIYPQLIGLGAMFLSCGLFLAVLGAGAEKFLTSFRTKLTDVTLAQWLMMLAAGVAGYSTYYALTIYLQSLGFRPN